MDEKEAEAKKPRFEFKNYKILLVIPLIVLLISAGILVNGYMQTGDWFKRSIELKGGTLINIESDKPVDTSALENSLAGKFGLLTVREIRSFSGYGILIEASSEVNANNIIQEVKNFGITVQSFSVQTIGPALGATFWIQAQLGLAVAFIFMGIIVFVIFRTLVPSLAVILAAAFDILFTLAFMQVFDIELSLAGLAALLMLIGYSVDTDILLTTRSLKGTGMVGQRIYGAMKTGLTMTFTAIGALAAMLIFTASPVLTQIASVLLIGLVFDIMNTWITNAALLKWYMERKGIV